MWYGWESASYSLAVGWVRDVLRLFDVEYLVLPVLALLDRFYARRPVVPREMRQLTLAAAMWIMSKYHDVAPLDAHQLVMLGDGAYTLRQLVSAEIVILEVCEWRLEGL